MTNLVRTVLMFNCLFITLTADASPPISVQVSEADLVANAGFSPTAMLRVSAEEHCIQMPLQQIPENFAAREQLKTNQHYSVSVSGAAYLSGQAGQDSDPVPGVVVFYCTSAQDGYATEYAVLEPGDTLRFHTPVKPVNKADVFLAAFFLDFWPESENHGEYDLVIVEQSADEHALQQKQEHALQQKQDVQNAAYRSRIAAVASLRATMEDQAEASDSSASLNITFAHDPGPGSYDGVIGEPTDVWNLIDVGVRESVGIQFADGTPTDVVAEISENDGEWGISGQSGVFHGYIYHNCRCVDLSVKLRYLPPGIYEVYVFAHGDAPDQNAAIEITSGSTTYSGKSTANNGTWDFRHPELTEGNQFVRYLVEVSAGSPLLITSKRDGSTYSLLNAIQLRRIMKRD